MSKTGFKGGRLGIGTDDPVYPLDVVGDIRLTGGFRDASGNDFNFIALAGPDIARSSDLADATVGIICKDNCVGIFNNNPSQSLDVSGNIRFTGDLLDINGVPQVFSNWTIDGTNIFRNSKVTIGDGSVNTNYDLFVNGHVKFQQTNVSKLINHLSSGTGIWYDYVNVQRFIINNEEKMRIHSDGNVGIGITNPGQKLEVNGNINIEGTQISINPSTEESYTYFSGVNSVYTTFQGNKNTLLKANNGKIFFAAGTSGSSSDRMVIDTAGNVGIGTTSPQGQLSLYKSGDNGGELWFGNSDINGATSKNYGKISFNTYLGGGVPYRTLGHIRCVPYGSNYGGDIIFNTYNDIYGGGDRMVIRGNGNVGIGTTNPYSKLEITAGADTSHIRISEGSHNNSSSTFLYPALTYYARQDNARRQGDPFNQRYGASASISFTDRPGTYTYVNAVRTSDIVFHTATSYVSPNLGHYPIERMRITAEGNVGIGANSPGEKLEVNGNIKTSGYFHYNSPIGGLVGDYPRGSVGDLYPIFCLNKDYLGTDGQAIPKYSVGFCYPPNCDVPGTSDHSWGMYIDGTTSSPNWEPYANWFLSGTKDKLSYMQSGRLGIGTTSPSEGLEIRGPTANHKIKITYHDGSYVNASLYHIFDYYSSNVYGNPITLNNSSTTDVHMCSGGGKVHMYGDGWHATKFCYIDGIPSTIQTSELALNITNTIHNGGFLAVNDRRTNGNSPFSDGAYFEMGEKRQGTYYITCRMRGYTLYTGSHSDMSNYTVSDIRIKKDIEDVPDDYALQKVRELPCRYYNYKDEERNGPHKIVGFIAQEVEEHLPGCVKKGDMPIFIPNICDYVNDVTWEKIGPDKTDPSKNVFKITCDEFQNYNNTRYRFYFSNNGSKILDEVLMRECYIQEDNSFIIKEIDAPYNYVYVYGEEIFDTITIAKQQIFALHHSAIQEIDRLQQADKAEIAELKNELKEMKTMLNALKSHLGL